jgi:hypothetical protein
MSENIWQQRSDEELIHASANLFEYTRVGEDLIRAELRRRSLPEPPVTKRSDTIGDGAEISHFKGMLWGVSIGAAVVAIVSLIDAFRIEESIRRGREKQPMLSFGTQLFIVAFVALIGALIGARARSKKLERDK